MRARLKRAYGGPGGGGCSGHNPITLPHARYSPPRRGLTVRFAVGDPAGARSAVWRMWTSRTKSDVYVSAWALTSVLKISLHESGDWQHAFTDTRGMAHVPPGQDRAMYRWYRPPEFSPGVTRAFEIMSPASEVTKPPYLEWDKIFHPEYADKEIVWVPPPPEGCATLHGSLQQRRRDSGDSPRVADADRYGESPHRGRYPTELSDSVARRFRTGDLRIKSGSNRSFSKIPVPPRTLSTEQAHGLSA